MVSNFFWKASEGTFFYGAEGFDVSLGDSGQVASVLRGAVVDDFSDGDGVEVEEEVPFFDLVFVEGEFCSDEVFPRDVVDLCGGFVWEGFSVEEVVGVVLPFDGSGLCAFSCEVAREFFFDDVAFGVVVVGALEDGVSVAVKEVFFGEVVGFVGVFAVPVEALFGETGGVAFLVVVDAGEEKVGVVVVAGEGAFGVEDVGAPPFFFVFS